MNLVQWLAKVTPAALIGAAFTGGVIWATLNQRLDTQARQIEELEKSLASLSATSQTRHDGYVDVDRKRSQEMTVAYMRIGALEERTKEFAFVGPDVRPTKGDKGTPAQSASGPTASAAATDPVRGDLFPSVGASPP